MHRSSTRPVCNKYSRTDGSGANKPRTIYSIFIQLFLILSSAPPQCLFICSCLWQQWGGGGGPVASNAHPGRGRGKVIPTGAPPRGSILMGRNHPRRWGRHVVAESCQGKGFSHGCTSRGTVDQNADTGIQARSIKEAACPIGKGVADPVPPRTNHRTRGFIFEVYYKTHGRICGSPLQPGNNTTRGVNTQTRVKKLHGVVTTIIRTTGSMFFFFGVAV